MANKIRTFLSTLGVIIGVATIIGVVGIGLGAQQQVAEQFKNLSVTSIVVVPSRGGNISSRLSEADLDIVVEKSPFIDRGSISITGNATVSFGKESEEGSILGIDENFFTLSNLEVEHGRLFTREDIFSRAKKVVLGHEIADLLFEENPSSAVGQTMTIGRRKMEVIGVLKENGANSFGTSYDDSVYAPYDTAEKNILGQGGRIRLVFLAKDVAMMALAEEDVTAILREEHRLKDYQEDDFRVFDPGSIVESATATAKVLSFVLTSVAAIVLLVSGIGIMNVMFVIVAERTKEIGVLKAIGAQKKDILSQFLLESVILCLCGGLIGALLGQAVVYFLRDYGAVYSVFAVVLGFSFSVFVGIFFGFYPALQASKLDPVDALRSE
ncbi:ABC transporter permease [Candidatus Gracilibacteria bacterium]|nr:ABC transporter permease [Candidatus Gracilibacteria bacterium]MCF7819295.1 ABC transporter permease [Candidatus Gracilibacteria bacterium]